jgi:uncharacterized membrane protein YphA (DoxX/SURF4 family)
MVIPFLELIGGVALILGLFVRYFGLLYTIEFIVAGGAGRSTPSGLKKINP